MAVIVGQGISVSPVADAELSHESTSTVQNKVVTDAIASEYSTRKTYSVGDVCTHDGKLYECIVDIPTAEGWTLAHWKVSNLGDNVSNLNRQLNDETTGLDTKAPVILETASGAIASFDDGADSMPVRKLVAQIEPVQDLHGYDHPWPGGASKNKLHVTRAAGTYTLSGVTFVVNDDGTITCSGTNTGSEILFNFTDIIPNNFNGDILNGAVSSNLGIACSLYQTSTGTYVTARVDTGTGSTINSDAPYCRFAVRIPAGSTVNGTVKPMVRLASESDATFVPYKNICPISGWTGLSGKRIGKNLIGIPGAIDNNGNINDNAYNLAHGIRSDIIPTTPGTVYTGSKVGAFEETWANLLVRFYDSNKSFIESRTLVSYNAQSGSVTVPNGICFVSFSVTQGGTSFDGYNVQVETGPSSTNYEPYTSESISVNWQDTAGTVYGGTLDVISGVLAVNRAMVDLGTLTWTYDSSATYPYFQSRAIVNNIKKTVNNNVPANVICSQYINVAANQPYLGHVTNCITVPTSGYVYIYDTSYTDAATFKTAMNGVQLVYELANPITYQLTPQEVTTLLGNNVVYTDVGPVSVEYPADTGKVVDELNRHLNDKITSPTSPASGAFLVWDGTAWVAQTLATWQGGSY